MYGSIKNLTGQTEHCQQNRKSDQHLETEAMGEELSFNEASLTGGGLKYDVSI